MAALYVEKGGSYWNLPGVDPWDEARDARQYAGRWPVVAHPPCQRWGKLWAGQPLWIKRTGIRKIKGDDGGCFAAALAAVRQWGGVLEHPWGSHAWPHFGLNVPPRSGGWVSADYLGGGRSGWTCCVEQGRYGHYARKPTLLYAVGCDLPELDWGVSEPQFPQWALDKYGLAKCKRAGELAFKGGGTDSAPRISTPEPFRDLLLSMARSAVREQASPPPSHREGKIMSDGSKPCRATPATTLEQHITDVNIPKNEAEWWAQRRIEALETQLAEAREALIPSGDTKAEYMGEFAFNLTRVDEYGDEYNERVYVPWTTIKEIMMAISARAFTPTETCPRCGHATDSEIHQWCQQKEPLK